MKKNIFFLIPALAITLLTASCNKDDAPGGGGTTATPQGRWVGTGQYGTAPGNPTYVFSLNFKADGTVDIVGNNNTAVDNATGTWALVADSVKATYKYASSSAIYRLSGKYTTGSTSMAGTIGLDPATTMVGIFAVTKQP